MTVILYLLLIVSSVAVISISQTLHNVRTTSNLAIVNISSVRECAYSVPQLSADIRCNTVLRLIVSYMEVALIGDQQQTNFSWKYNNGKYYEIKHVTVIYIMWLYVRHSAEDWPLKSYISSLAHKSNWVRLWRRALRASALQCESLSI